MYLSIDIGEGIRIGDVDQPNVLLAFDWVLDQGQATDMDWTLHTDLLK